jgi:hypothetical protein
MSMTSAEFRPILRLVAAFVVGIVAVYFAVLVAFAVTTGVNWSYALSGAEVASAWALSASLVVAMVDLHRALTPARPRLALSAKRVGDGSPGGEWEVVLWNTGDEDAEGVRVWLRDRTGGASAPNAGASFAMSRDDWETTNGHVRWVRDGQGWMTWEHQVRAKHSLPRNGGRFVVVARFSSLGTFEVTARCANGADPKPWDSSQGDLPEP